MLMLEERALSYRTRFESSGQRLPAAPRTAPGTGFPPHRVTHVDRSGRLMHPSHGVHQWGVRLKAFRGVLRVARIQRRWQGHPGGGG